MQIWLRRVLVSLTTVLSTGVQAMGPEHFVDYVWGRAGGGELIHRLSIGWAYDISSGRIVAKLEGLETAMAIPSVAEPGTVYHVARVVLLYRDPTTGAVLAEYPGRDPEALTSVSAYSFDGQFRWSLGDPGNDAPPIVIPGTVDCQTQGTTLFCERSSVYPRENGATVLEYRWTVDRGAASIEAAARSEFVETEPSEPEKGVSDGPLMIRLTSYRVPDWEALPPTLRDWVEQEAPGFAVLPEPVRATIEAAGFSP
jgi:hypothetical protein